MAPDEPTPAPHCLVTGATGYIGGRLVPELPAAGHRVRCLARSPDRLRDHPWRSDTEVVKGDVTDKASLTGAMTGTDVAYYLVHALGTGADFEETDRRAARNLAETALAAGVRRIVYLGGLTPAGSPRDELSPHLRSRAEVGRIFLEGAVPATVLRAAVIIGSGSASFEMLRYLTERLPVMVTSRWVHSLIQPIGVRDVLRYLTGSARMPREANRTFDEPGAPLSLDAALSLALKRIQEAQVATRWSSASLPGAPSDPLPVARAVREWLDRFVGGVGLRRGRRDAQRLRAGDSLDFWRVEEIEPGRLLRLRAEMRLPGLAWLEMYCAVHDSGRTLCRQRALFHPRGLFGRAYWWSVAPFHALVFGGMAHNITRAAVTYSQAQRAAGNTAEPPDVRTD